MVAAVIASLLLGPAPPLWAVERPAWRAMLAPGGAAPVRACGGRPPSDVHAYAPRGRALRQDRALRWRDARGRLVAAYDRRGRTFRARRGPVLVAAWCG
jgi:hypothetical protein